ncbi:hypothetical protein BS47DRAFT_203166 [Hydnum rufescens UP504]|uniref:Uncharacterized protein n=1 Tax=Hydnum rufescens UP504 TaxID=1448309 RepID=A0A9P6AN04_9AGAM|nr:hypothetical protein BS47DRAFT_203166 [Hydnum rufescens UP504]
MVQWKMMNIKVPATSCDILFSKVRPLSCLRKITSMYFFQAPSPSLASGVSLGTEMSPDTETFRPERFTKPDEDGQLSLDPHKFAFAVRRRPVSSCCGRRNPLINSAF